ncbi:MAG: hypothetical protein ABI572_10740 [Actinomycetota bacterium]
MKLLRRILKTQAVLWAAWGLSAIVVPRWVVETVMRQPALSDPVWLRTIGVMSVVLALLMALVSQKLEDVWWWSWAFAVLQIGAATVFVLHALVDLPDGASAWPWWAMGAAGALLGGGLLFGMAEAGQEKPFV